MAMACLKYEFLAPEVLDWESLYIPEPNTGCWLWLGAYSAEGEPEMEVGARVRSVRELAYEASYGPIPSSCRVEPACSLSCCVNPHHMATRSTHADEDH
jgi:hypothetical protein